MTEDPLGIDYMCPFCVTPWKCNGPHIEPDHLSEFHDYVMGRVNAEREQIISMLNEYIDSFHTHVGDFTCLPMAGDTCDMTAAVRVAVNKVKARANVA